MRSCALAAAALFLLTGAAAAGSSSAVPPGYSIESFRSVVPRYAW